MDIIYISLTIIFLFLFSINFFIIANKFAYLEYENKKQFKKDLLIPFYALYTLLKDFYSDLK